MSQSWMMESRKWHHFFPFGPSAEAESVLPYASNTFRKASPAEPSHEVGNNQAKSQERDERDYNLVDMKVVILKFVYKK